MIDRSGIGNARALYPYPLLLLLLAAIPLYCSAQPIHAVPGEEVPLGGTAPGSDVVYLFLTGPNLPAGGINLIDGSPVRTGDPESFTRVEVLTGGIWSYRWRAGVTGRILDPGTYTVYAVLEPFARPDLGGAEYTTRAVILGAPAETAAITTAPKTGTISVRSTPDQAAVTLDGSTAGTTPLTLTGVPAGSHTLVIARGGYMEYRQTLVMPAGGAKEVSAVLEPLAPSPSVPGTGTPSAPVPTRVASLTLVPVGAFALLILALSRRR